MKLLQLCSSLLLLLLLPIVLARFDEDVQHSQELRINWLPVWDSDAIAGDPKQIVSDESLYDSLTQRFPSGTPHLAEELGPCDAPNGLGLRNLLKQAQSLLPLERIRHIIRGSAGDAEVRALLQLLRSSAYRERAGTLQRSREYIGFEDYVCYKLNLDLKRYIHFVCGLLDLSVLDAAPATAAQDVAPFQGRAGIRGLLLDIRAALPRQQLHDMYESLLRSDMYLARTVARIHTREFKALFGNLRRNTDYMALWQSLQDAGVPMHELRDLIDVSLGWYKDELDKDDALDTMI